MPNRVAYQTRRLLCHIGRRGAFLAFLALVDEVIGYSLTQPLPFRLSRDVLYEPFVHVAPLKWWAGAWIGIGLVAALATVWHRARVVMFGLGTALKTAWALGYLAGWIRHDSAYIRGYQTAAIFASFAAVTLLVAGWRENGQ